MEPSEISPFSHLEREDSISSHYSMRCSYTQSPSLPQILRVLPYRLFWTKLFPSAWPLVHGAYAHISFLPAWAFLQHRPDVLLQSHSKDPFPYQYWPRHRKHFYYHSHMELPYPHNWNLQESNLPLCLVVHTCRRSSFLCKWSPNDNQFDSNRSCLPVSYTRLDVYKRQLVACFRSKVLGNYVHDCSRFTVGSDRTIFYPGTLWICQLSSCGPVFSMRPLLTFPLLRNRIQTCRISARLCSTSVFFSCQYFYIKNMQNIRIF